MEMTKVGLFVIFLVAGQYIGQGLTLSDEKRLIKHLVDNYERVGTIGRPVNNITEIVEVKFGLALIQIFDLDEHNQVLSTQTWMRYIWSDNLLRWSPEEFGGVNYVRIPISKIWSPDIFLYNSVQHDNHYTSNLNDGGALAVVSSDGEVLFVPRMNLQSTCSIDFTYFPWDTQHCTLKFGSWTYDGHLLDVNFYADMEEFDMSDYIPSNEWEVLEHSVVKNKIYYTCCEEPYLDLTFELKLKRISTGNQMAFILPTSLLTILTVLIFYIPPVMDAKFNLGMIVFLGYFILLLTINSVAPFGGMTTSRLVSFLGAGICLVAIAIILSAVTMNLARKGKRGIPLPKMLQTIFNNCLGRILCVCTSSRDTGGEESLITPLDDFARDWETFATVLDRIFMVVFAVMIIIFAIAIR